MTASHFPRLNRRIFLQSAAAFALLTSTSPLVSPALAQPEPFDFDRLSAQMSNAAARPYATSARVLPDALAELDYDGYRKVQFITNRARTFGEAPYQVHAFAPGWLFQETVELFEVADGLAKPLAFSGDDFDFHDEAVKAKLSGTEFPGIAGFRINTHLNKPDAYDELVSFLGASYFRALGRGNSYGLSARGLALDSWVDGPEEFPRFTRFYIERPTSVGGPIAVFATLDGPSVTGAYRFVISPANSERQTTEMDVTARLFFRKDVKELGIAPLTSMFLFGEVNRGGFDDYRPQVHDSNGLSIEREDGEVYWRPLTNTPSLGNSYFWENNPKAFGLYQRGRDFETYQDAGAHYERRPSARIEPTGEWGQGMLRLIEIPSRLEVDDNIVAFWVPAEPVKAGESREFQYRLIWGDLSPDPQAGLAHVVETRGGKGGVSGVESEDSLRKFVVDFKGAALANPDPNRPFDVVAQATGGQVISSALSYVSANDTWRLVLDVMIESDNPVELKAYLVGAGMRVTETWLYQWRPLA